MSCGFDDNKMRELIHNKNRKILIFLEIKLDIEGMEVVKGRQRSYDASFVDYN